MNKEQPPQAPRLEDELSPDQIEQVFSVLDLQSEGDRLKFKVMAEVPNPAREPSRIWSSATTTYHEERQGEGNA